MTLGQKLKELRTLKGLTQKELADKLHVSFQTVSKWENGENEPDIATLKELASMFNCSVDYLIGQDEFEKSPSSSTEGSSQTVIIHQKEMHVCEHCKKDIPENDLVMEDICIRRGGRGRSAEYRKAYYHSACLAEVKKGREKAKAAAKAAHAAKAKKWSFFWGIFGGVIALVATLIGLLVGAKTINPAVSVLLSILAGYGIFSMLYCIISGSYIGDVFVWCAGLSIKFPGIIFSWDIDGVVWAIAMKIFFAILGFLVGLFALAFAIVLSAALGMISFPFVLIHNNKTQYEDSLFD